MSSNARSDTIGRIIGMLVFLIGVALIVYVFSIAHSLFTQSPAEALGIKFTGNPKTDPKVEMIGSQFTWLLFRIAYLLIMGFAGSLLANKGVNLYFSALQGAPVTFFRPPREEDIKK